MVDVSRLVGLPAGFLDFVALAVWLVAIIGTLGYWFVVAIRKAVAVWRY